MTRAAVEAKVECHVRQRAAKKLGYRVVRAELVAVA
jgi:hypothetical protein